MAAVLQCQFCELVALSDQLLKKHIRQTHSHDPDFNIQCHVGGCQTTFNNYRTYTYIVKALQQRILPFFKMLAMI